MFFFLLLLFVDIFYYYIFIKEIRNRAKKLFKKTFFIFDEATPPTVHIYIFFYSWVVAVFLRITFEYNSETLSNIGAARKYLVAPRP